MNAQFRPRFKHLATVTAAAVYLLIVVGGVVRVTGSGLGCPDWPLCYGRALPPAEITALIEFTHRVVAAAGGILMIATCIAAWRRHRTHPWIVRPATAAVALLAVQVPLGGVIVLTELKPLVVAFHLGMAMLIFACTLLTAVAAHKRAGHTSPVSLHAMFQGRFNGLLLVTLGALYILLLTGALVVGSDAQLACLTWPLCAGSLLPAAGADPLVLVHLLHRYTVAAVALLTVLVIVSAYSKPNTSLGVLGWAALLGGMFAAQVMIGAIQIFLNLPAVLRALHLATASGVWAALVVMTGLTMLRPALVETAATARVDPQQRLSPSSGD